MLKYIKNHMESIDGIEVYPLVSLIIFVAFFLGLFIWVVRMDKRKSSEMSQYPLND
ncbi:cytochrome C oxidase subunit IV [Crocinitomix algicola]|uniref:cytochrome C oxidase subunit IV n=1 Tax=Crocinitomix algicola TaxID=1740263 RepID=UPI0009F1F914|nr:cytochrome C oxidase subunit IV [Crocinitomix algicola]